MSASLPHRFTVNAAGSYLDAKLFDVPGAYSGVRTVRPAQAPKYTFNTSITKTMDVGPGQLRLSWSGDYVSSRFSSVDNHAGTHVKGSFMHNARVTYELPQPGLEFAFWVRNISNIRREESTFYDLHFFGAKYTTYAQPRWIGGSIRKSF